MSLGPAFLALILAKVRAEVVVPIAQELQVTAQGLSHKSSLLEVRVNTQTSSMQSLAVQLSEKFAQHESKIQSLDSGVLSQFSKVDGSMVVLRQSLEDMARRERQQLQEWNNWSEAARQESLAQCKSWCEGLEQRCLASENKVSSLQEYSHQEAQRRTP